MKKLPAVLFALLLTHAAPRPATAGPLPDSTSTDAWRLENGLEVRVRNVPGAGGVAIAIAYRAGRLYEPAARAGVTDLLADLEFTAPCADVPARSVAEMPSLRPLGWGYVISPQLVVLTEIASAAQFPGVLRQCASRMRGVDLEAGSLRAALDSTRAGLARRGFSAQAELLHDRLRAVAEGMSDEAFLRRASGQGLANLQLAEVRALLRERFVPANAALSLAGDFRGLDVRTLVLREFGGIPAGAPMQERPDPVLAPGARSALLAGLPRPLGGVGVIAPALDDSLHPAFVLATLAAGSWLREHLGAPRPPLTNRFEFSLIDEPDLVGFYLEPPPETTETADLRLSIQSGFQELEGTEMPGVMLKLLRARVGWLLGGPVPDDVRRRTAREPGILGTLAGGAARRALWHGDGWWDGYRARFMNTSIGHNGFMPYMEDPKHQVLVLVRPAR